MSAALPSGYVVPTPQPAKTFGLLNVIFGILLILWGACQGAGALAMPFLPQFFEGIQTKVQTEVKAEREGELKALAEAEKAATTDEEKAQIVAQRAQIEATPVVDPIGPMKAMFGMYEDRRFLTYYWAEALSGIVLNGLMIASGLGLMKLRESGRRLALGVAAAKIVRLIALVVVVVAVIAPLTAEYMKQMAAAMPAAGGPAMGGLMQQAAASASIQAVAFAVFGSIYPVLTLWFLTRPGVRAACLAKPKADGDPFA